jgi:WD40 repeat protein/serine/threonine protein kinase
MAGGDVEEGLQATLPGAGEAGATTTLVGRTLGDFLVQDLLGEGGFGAVYRAQQKLLGREAVVKVLHGRHRATERHIQRFLREARLASTLDHPYAAHIYAFGAEPDGLLWIAMELVRGTPLDQLLASTGPLSLERFVPLLDKICEVLATAHEQGIVHRDIKPANIMVLSRAGRLLPKLLDFGIAKSMDAPVATPATPENSEPIAINDAASSATTRPGGAAHSGDSGGPVGALTRAGAVMGSPPYMAPEQWANSPSIGPGTDLYALATLSYEALTGRVPYAARTLVAFAKAHARSPVPPLGGAFPIALDGVMQRAMAKRVEDRYATTLEFAQAFRDAAGFTTAPESVPRLDETIRDAALADLPQPLAEAVAAYEGARGLLQAHEALAEICTIASHFVGVVALAAHTRTASGDEGRTTLIETLRILRRRTLQDSEWVDLARALLRADAARREVHAVPELVALFDRDDPFAAPLELFADRPRGMGEAEARSRVERGVPLVQRLLRGLGLFSDYTLAVVRGGRAERWVGLRRGKRVAVALPRPIDEGTVLLVARDGTPVLVLSPLVQVAEPAPGAIAELFLFEGQGRHGARLAARPGGYERGDESIWTWLRAYMPAETSDGASDAPVERTPYRGLSAFASTDADVFVGRERECETALNRLRTQAFLAVVGPSGAGKSSFVHAGLVPSLSEQLVVSMRPGAKPLETLAARLERAGATPSLATRLRAQPAIIRDVLKALGPSGATLVVDQLEEAFTLCRDDRERRAFFACLAAAGASIEEPLRVIVTLRDDFLMSAEGEPELRAHLDRGLCLVGTPSPDELERILVEPARRAGYALDDRALAAEMVAAVVGRPGALPLLSFAMQRMWELRDRHFKQLTRKVYDAIGGVVGALAQHADETLDALPGAEQAMVREAFRHLVTAEGTRAVLSRAELIEVLGKGPHAAPLAEKLIASRLLAASETEGGDRVEITHEALLVAWPRLVRWRQEDAEGARLRDQLRAAARQWEERNRPAGLLWRDEALAELQLWRARHGGALTEVDAAFADASVNAAQRGRRRLRATITIAFAVLLLGSLALLQLGRRARAGEHEAQARVAELYEEDGRKALLEGQPQRAIVYLSEAYSRGHDTPALHFLVAQARAALSPLLRPLVGHEDDLISVALARTHDWAVTGSRDQTARMWSATTGETLWRFPANDRVRYVELVDRDAHVLTVGMAGAASLWSTSDGKLVRRFEVGPCSTALVDPAESRLVVIGPETVSAFTLADGLPLWKTRLASAPVPPVYSGDGNRLLIVDQEGKAALLDAGDGHVVARLSGGYGFGRGALDHDGRRIVLPDLDGTIRVFSAEGKELLRIAAHLVGANAAALSHDGRRIVSSGSERIAKVWEASTGKQLLQLEGHAGPIGMVRFGEDDDTIITSSEDGTVRIWDAQIGQPRAVLHDHAGTIWLGALRGDRAITFGTSHVAKLWDITRSSRLRALVHAAAVRDAQYLDGDRIATVCEDGKLRVWSADAKLERTVSLGNGGGMVAAMSVDGRRIAAARSDGIALFSDDPGAAVALRMPRVRAMRFSPDGTQLCAVGNEGAANLWSADDGTLVSKLEGHEGIVLDVAFAGDGKLLATVGVDRSLRVWDRQGRLQRTLRGHLNEINSVSFSGDGRAILTVASDNAARVWDAHSGAVLASIDGQSSILNSAAIDHDGGRAAIGLNDGSIQIWDVASGRQLARLEAHAMTVYALSFSRDGRRLLSGGGGDRRAFVWDLATDRTSASTLAEWVRCHVPWHLEGSAVVAAHIPDECVKRDAQVEK